MIKSLHNYVVCSIHKGEATSSLTVGQASTLYTQIRDSIINWKNPQTADQAETYKDYLEWAKSQGLSSWQQTNPKNDNIRGYMLHKYGGTWPEMKGNYYDINGNKIDTSNMYIQSAFHDAKATQSSEKSVIIYSSTNKDDSGSKWTASFIYNDAEKCWYQYIPKGTYQTVNKTYETVMNDLKNSTLFAKVTESSN